jgi:hypothetical protein
MKRRAVLLLACALLFALGTASTVARTADDWADARLLVGVWEGTHTQTQVGTCSAAGYKQLAREVRVVFRVDDGGKVKAGLTFLPAAADMSDNLTVRVEQQKIFVDKHVTASCGQNFTRKYVIKLELGASIEADGTRRLQLVGMNVPCIQMGCRFRDVYDLTYKGEPK